METKKKKPILTGILIVTALMYCIGCGEDTTEDTPPSVTLTVRGSGSAAADRAPLQIGSPAVQLNMEFSALYISENEDCSDAVLVESFGDTALPFNLLADPVLFQGNPPDGTYNCLIFSSTDYLSYEVDDVAAANHPGCSEATLYEGDLYRDGEGDDGMWKDADGSPVDATGSTTVISRDNVAFFASIDIDAAINGPLGTHMHQTINLTAPLVVPGQVTFFADFNNGIEGNIAGTACALEGGAGFGFR